MAVKVTRNHFLIMIRGTEIINYKATEMHGGGTGEVVIALLCVFCVEEPSRDPCAKTRRIIVRARQPLSINSLRNQHGEFQEYSDPCPLLEQIDRGLCIGWKQ